jgi:GTP-binding protein
MQLRNIAIIAHVDHGKTTLVDQLLAQSGTFRANQRVAERVLDSGDLERERGITILAKCTSLMWKGTRINIVDTPGHADFGGEVERILNMVDGAVVLVDAAEGPMPQTKFVVGKALQIGLRPIVAVNKIDRADARPVEVVNEVFDLFAALDASDDQLDFPILYGSGREGWMAPDASGPGASLAPLFDLICEHVPPPEIEPGPFRMLGTILEADPYLGRLITGRITSGRVRANDTIKAIGPDGAPVDAGRVTRILAFRGIERRPIGEGTAGDIVAIAGLSRASVADTFCAPGVDAPLPAQPIDPPTVEMTFIVNDSPLAGREGRKVTGRMIGERLEREAEGNVTLRIARGENRDGYLVSGRGELQLAILIETMRREGYELGVSRPRVVMRRDAETQALLEPIEEVLIDVDEGHAGAVVRKLTGRKAVMVDMRPSGGGRRRLVFHAPTRGLIGYQSELMTDTRGTAVMNRLFHAYEPHRGPIEGRVNGVLIASEAGEAVAYALWNLEERGQMVIEPGARVYPGMIVGIHSRANDLEVNVLKGKKLTNIRTHARDEAVRLTPPVNMTIERALAWINDDELVEVTPTSIRLRKALLDPHERRRAGRIAAAAGEA